MIYTFYSFKGGVGRSMALANIAELLYGRGLKVLMVDFDLEAPGLERYFNVPNALYQQNDILNRRGIIDMLISYKEISSLPSIKTSPKDSTRTEDTFLFSAEPLKNFCVQIYEKNAHGGELILIPSGRRGENEFTQYTRFVQSFDWQDFYLNWNGEEFFDWFRQQSETLADVVLIDSRTGITEMGGICTHHLADVVVMFIASNQQNLDGTLKMANSLSNPELIKEGRKGRKLSLLPVPSRIENFEADLLDEFAEQFKHTLDKFIDPKLRFEESSFSDLKIPYTPYYAYQERVAIREAHRDSATDLVKVFEHLASTLACLAPEDSRLHKIAGLKRIQLKAGSPFQSPPLPNCYVRRSKDFHNLKDLLISTEKSAFGSLSISTIHGLAGVGKSVLAAALAHDSEVQKKFVDGVLWTTLGQEPDVLYSLNNWIQSLGDYEFKPKNIEAASNHLRLLLYEKHVLLIVDDVWNVDDLEPFCVGGVGCHLLVTTRGVSIPNTTKHDLEVMTTEQSLELLTKKCPEELSEEEHEQAIKLVEALGNLPLALELAATQLEGGVTFVELIEDIQAEVARLEVLDLPSIQTHYKNNKNYSLLASLKLSLQQLSPKQQQQFAWLGVLPEDVLITQDLAATLWGLSSRQAASTLRTLRSRALLLSGTIQIGQKPTYRIHDLLHDMARRMLTGNPKPQGESDLPGLGLEMKSAHSRLIDLYSSKIKNNLWHTLPYDGYIHTHLIWHFRQADQLDEVHKLLQEKSSNGRNGWFEASEHLGQTTNFIADVARAWQLAEELFVVSPARAIGLQCRYALINASVNSLASNIPPELISALVKNEYWQPMQGLSYIRRIQNPSQRAQAVSQIIPFLPESLLSEALEICHQIQSELDRSSALVALIPLLPEVASEVLEISHKIQSRSAKSKILCQLIPLLPRTLIPKALETAHQIQSRLERLEVLCVLIPHLPEVAAEALEIIRDIQSGFDRSRALSTLAPHLPESSISEALEIVHDIQSEFDRSTALSMLVPHLPKGSMAEALEVARCIQSEFARSKALSVLIPYLPEIAAEALEVARCIQSEFDRSRALNALVPYLPEVTAEALEVACGIQSEFDRSRVLSALAPHLSKALLLKALDATNQIQSEFDRSRVLSALAPHLSKALLLKALDATNQIRSHSAKLKVLIALAPHLPEVLPLALEITRSVQSNTDRQQALCELAPHLPKSLLLKALEISYVIQDESAYTHALQSFALFMSRELELSHDIQNENILVNTNNKLITSEVETVLEELDNVRTTIRTDLNSNDSDIVGTLINLASRLPDSLISEVLEIVGAFQNDYHRSVALCSLAPHLPVVLLPEALEIVRTIQDGYYRGNAMSGLLPRLSLVSISHTLWCEVLHNLSNQNRQALLNDLPILIPVIVSLGGISALHETISAIKEVCQQWSSE